MTETSQATSPRVGAPVRAYVVVLAVVWVVMAVSTLPGVRSQPGVLPVYDDWLQSAGYVLAAGLVVWRVVQHAQGRLLWSLIALALVLRAAGFVHFIFVLDRAPAYPSLADVFWAVSALALLTALLVAASRHAPRMSRTLALDAVIGAVTAGAVAWLLLGGTLARLTPPGAPAEVVTTNLAYPGIDVALLMVLTALVAATHGRLPWATATVCAGVLTVAVVDWVFLYQVTTGAFRPGSYLTPLSLGGTTLIAVAAWLPHRDRRPPSSGAAGLVTPVVMSLFCVAVLSDDAVRPVPSGAVVLASAGVLLAIVRAYFTFTRDRQETEVVIAAKDVEIERFQALVEASDDFIAIATVDGRLVYLNPAGKRLVGLPEHVDVAGTTIGDYVPALACTPLGEARPGLMERGTWRGDSELLDHRGGPPIPVTANTFVLRDPDTGEPGLMATVQRDISELRTAQAALQELADQRQTLLGHLVEAQEAERAKIAADVHDDSVQALAAVDLQLGLLRRRLAKGDGEALRTLDQLHETVRGATERLRHLLFDLDSPAQRSDLRTVLEEAAAVLFEPALRWRVDFEDGVDLPESPRVMAHRMAKEAMVNIGKHARATTAVVTVRRAEGGVEVEVADDGIGIDPGDLELRPGHRGLSDMRDRVAIAGGRVVVERRPEGGTRVRLWLPSSADPA